MGHDYSTAAFRCSSITKKKLVSKKHKNQDSNIMKDESVSYIKVCKRI